MKEYKLEAELWLPRSRDVERIFRYRQQRMKELFGNERT